jgi:hypothetical protein
MKSYRVVLCVVLSALEKPVTAQLVANPVYFSPKTPIGLTLAADFGNALSTKFGSAKSTVHPNHVGVRALLGLPIISIGVGAGRYNPDTSGVNSETQFAADAALKLLSLPLVPVGIALQAGAGYLQTGSGVNAAKLYNVPIGLGVSVKPPTPGLSVEPWVAPRVQLRAYSAGGTSTFQTGIGVSGGVNLGLPTGLGLHAALDWSKLSAKTKGTLNLPDTETMLLGIGLHYTFTIPGLPMVPVI